MAVPISSPYNLEDDIGEFPESVNSWHSGQKRELHHVFKNLTSCSYDSEYIK